MNKNLQHIILIAVLLLLSTGAAIGLRAWLHPILHLQAVELLPEPYQSLHGYTLTFIEGKPLKLDAAKGQWMLLLFGHSACPTDCLQARTLTELGKMLKQFGAEGQEYIPQVVFINLDPGQDNLDKQEAYVHAFHIDIGAVTGHNDELARLANFFGFTYNGTAMMANKSHVENVPSRIFIIDPQLRYIGSFAAPQNADTLYSDMEQLNHQLWRYHVHR